MPRQPPQMPQRATNCRSKRTPATRAHSHNTDYPVDKGPTSVLDETRLQINSAPRHHMTTMGCPFHLPHIPPCRSTI
eukprot:8928419-Pyramimonas_sp.AAC.1